LAGLFQEFNPIARMAANQYGPSTNNVGRGSLISFYYPMSMAKDGNYQIRDVKPMLIITHIGQRYIYGVNLHYLALPFLRTVVLNHGGDSGFSWRSRVKADGYMADAYRMYVRRGIQRPKVLDIDWLKKVLYEIQSFDPSQLKAIRDNIQKQIQQRLQAKADQLTSYEEWRASLEKGQQQEVQQMEQDAYRQWYRSLSPTQQRQMRSKSLEGQQIVERGLDENLINPPPEPTPIDENL
jgi:hypothetical protein